MTTKIKDVAAAAGVSAATVSRVLNDNSEVNPELRDRVLDAVKRLGYRPNGAARSLRTRATMVVGLIISDITNPFFTAMVRGVEDAAQEAGYSVILANADEDVDKEARYLEVAVAEQMAGIVLSPAGASQPRLDLLAERNVPIVMIDRRIPGYDSVTIPNRQLAKQATCHLIEQGWKRVGFVAGPNTTTTARERLEGYRAALRESGRAVDPDLIRVADYRIDGGHDAAHALLSAKPPPDALLVSNNLMTIGALDALAEAGLTAPGDIGFVGFDDVTWALGHRSRITTVEQPTYDIGRRAGELLLARIRGDATPARRIVLPAELVVRDSSLNKERLRPA
jgi:LacI family transcriptional regulator